MKTINLAFLRANSPHWEVTETEKFRIFRFTIMNTDGTKYILQITFSNSTESEMFRTKLESSDQTIARYLTEDVKIEYPNPDTEEGNWLTQKR